MKRPDRGFTSAVLLFFVAPFIAEFLLGDLPLRLLAAMIVLAPLYGGGALLLREVARRERRGWPTMLLLGAAYAVLEEGLVTQSLFNPDYLSLHGHFLDPAHITWLGTGGWWTMLMLNLHTFWSIGVSVALVEALDPESSTLPWLGPAGDTVIASIFAVGLAVNALIGWKQNHFRATPMQLGVAGAICLFLMALAFVAKGRAKPNGAGNSVSPWVTGGIALFLGAAVRAVPPRWGWGAAAAMAAVDVLFLSVISLLVSRSRWTIRQTFGLAAGGTLVYGLYAFSQAPITGGTRSAAVPGHVLFLAVAVWLLVVGARRTAKESIAGVGRV